MRNKEGQVIQDPIRQTEYWGNCMADRRFKPGMTRSLLPVRKSVVVHKPKGKKKTQVTICPTSKAS